jgi:heme O synthase-like polyprenyltransferase
VPRWLAISIPVSFVVMILGGTGIVYDLLHAVFMATLVTLAWYLLRASRTGSQPAGK